MEKVLGAAGLPSTVLEHVPSIIETCRECRVWQKPGPSITPSVEIVTDPNQEVEGDIMFYKRYQAWHMVDRCDRWEAAVQILSKTTEQLIEAIDVCWISIHGPFKHLVVDGARGRFAGEAVNQLNRCL